jgi:UDP-N-acetylmuramate: L-alanyl-gamma-D-glutamyl-meso-diaminopimelate ligase
MSTQLAESGIPLCEGYEPSHLDPAPGLTIIGNALSRGNPAIEHLLDEGLPYCSGPAWLAEHILAGRHVLAVAGTHGKTSTACMLAWVLEAGGLAPGFLIGGVPLNFGRSARLGSGRPFVVEADEYDTAFFDKRSKFVHYRPRTLVISNIEFDHGDIFPDLDAIKRQFHHLVRTVPARGLILRRARDAVIDEVLALGCWTPTVTFGEGEAAAWGFRRLNSDCSAFEVLWKGGVLGRTEWRLAGTHNACNALAAIGAAREAGVDPRVAIDALCSFEGIKRRLEQLALVRGIAVYDDFAHHPTEIRATLAALRPRVRGGRLIALFEPRSNTMRLGLHPEPLGAAFTETDLALFYRPPGLSWDLTEGVRMLGDRQRVYDAIETLIEHLCVIARPGDHVLIMSNGAFGGIHDRLVAALKG